MLEVIGEPSIDSLFADIPSHLRSDQSLGLPPRVSENELMRVMRDRAAKDPQLLNFIGAGAYEHHVPGVVIDLMSRGEFYTAYTPYQPEASQGTLQVIFEFQTMLCELTGMEVANASLYDGASAFAEAVLMAVRLQKTGARKIVIPESIHPFYRETLETIVSPQGISFIDMPVDSVSGTSQLQFLETLDPREIAAIAIPQVNFYGMLEPVDEMTDWSSSHHVISIAVVNPLLLSVLNAPGDWGKNGADIAIGDGQPLGLPLSSGGAYYGFMCTRDRFVRQMPGRLVGRAVDAQGRDGFVLTLQAREQHIRRSKATSNICTNQGLMVTASTIYMALMGQMGLISVATKAYENFHELCIALGDLGVHPAFNGLFFHEILLRTPVSVDWIYDFMLERGILPGLVVESPINREKMLLVCATETRTRQDLETYVSVMSDAIRTYQEQQGSC